MPQRVALFTPVLIVGCVIITLSFSVRSSFGLFQIPIADEFGWLRAEFSLAIAIQNLVWGIGQPVFGALAKKVGDRKAIIVGGLIYIAGLMLSSQAVTPDAHQAYAWLIGFGVADTGFEVILAAVGRAASDDNRSMALAVVTVAGSMGQIIGPSGSEWLLSFLPWQTVFFIFAAIIFLSLLSLPFMSAPQG